MLIEANICFVNMLSRRTRVVSSFFGSFISKIDYKLTSSFLFIKNFSLVFGKTKTEE